MLPRRGYEPVDDGDEDDTTNQSNSSSSAGARNITPTSTTTGDNNAKSSTTSDNENGGNDGEEDGKITVRVLDVRGQFYPLRVHPENTVRELKQDLVNATGVEFERQRIIHGGKMLGDADTLASRKIADGAAVHLFQRPKTDVPPVGGAAGVVSTAQQPGRLHEFPPVLLRVQGAGAGGSTGATGYMNSHWEVDGPRKQIRFLASFLLLISVMQLLECLASMSAAVSYPGAAGNGGDSGGGDGGAYTELPDEYWVLIKGRSVSSLMGIVVGVLGIRGSQSLNSQTIKMYFVGLVMCAIVAMVIRIEVFVDIITGKIPFGDYGMGSPNSSDDYTGEGGGAEGGGSDAGAGGPGGRGAHHETAEEAESSLFFTAFSAFVSVVVSGGVWLLCIKRVSAMRSQISEHMVNWERREVGEEPEQAYGNGLMDAISDPELERRRGGADTV